MFIIFGSPRSGTTLLSTTLNLNDHITIPDESDFIIPAAFILDRIKDPCVGKQLLENLIVNTERYEQSLGHFLEPIEARNVIKNSRYQLYDIINNLYQLMANKNNTQLGGDKSPNDLLYLRILIDTSMFESDIKIIHIVRDVRDVVLSLRNVNWNFEGKDKIEKFLPRLWSDTNLYLYNMFKYKPDKYLFVKYEDMVLNPRCVFEQITKFLNVPYQEKMFNHSERGLDYKKYSHHVNLSMPFLVDKINTWKGKPDPLIIKECNKQATEALREFGYIVPGRFFNIRHKLQFYLG